jgi:hypothetical protein
MLKHIKHTELLFIFSLLLLHSSLLAQWIQTTSNLGSVSALVVNDTNLFAGDPFGVYLTTNNGTNWNFAGPTKEFTFPPINIHTIICKDTTVLTGSDSGIYRSTNNGTTWAAINNGLTSKTVHALTFQGTNLFAGTDSGVFLSTNNGSSWKAVNTGLPKYGVYALTVNDTNIFAGAAWYSMSGSGGGSGGGVYISTNSGETWSVAGTGFPNVPVNTIAVSSTNIFVGFAGGGLCRSTDNGTSWNLLETMAPNRPIEAFALNGTNLFAATWNGGVELSIDNGTTWDSVNTGLTDFTVATLALNSTYIFTGAWNTGVWRRQLSEITSVNLSSDRPAREYYLGQNYPNPFNPTTSIKFVIPKNENVSITIFDILGKQVSTLIDGQYPAGEHTIQWNAEGLSSGVYFYRLMSTSYIGTRKLLLLK